MAKAHLLKQEVSPDASLPNNIASVTLTNSTAQPALTQALGSQSQTLITTDIIKSQQKNNIWCKLQNRSEEHFELFPNKTYA